MQQGALQERQRGLQRPRPLPLPLPGWRVRHQRQPATAPAQLLLLHHLQRLAPPLAPQDPSVGCVGCLRRQRLRLEVQAQAGREVQQPQAPPAEPSTTAALPSLPPQAQRAQGQALRSQQPELLPLLLAGAGRVAAAGTQATGPPLPAPLRCRPVPPLQKLWMAPLTAPGDSPAASHQRPSSLQPLLPPLRAEMGPLANL